LFDDDDYDDDDDLEFDSLYLRDSLLLSSDSRERIRRLNSEQYQRRLLGVNGIDSLDRPGLPRWAKHLPEGINELRKFEHLSVELGNLPLRGETAQYKQRIRESLQALKAKQHDFYPLLLPVELDVQVFSHAPKLSKDLDNIMRDVAPVVKEELLHPDSYVHGYRIYVADTDASEHKSDFLRLKLLPANAVSHFEDRMRKTFEVAGEWLEEEIYKHH
jgi:hypothetical protein